MRRFGDDLESPGLGVLELDEIAVVDDDLVAFVVALLEEFGEGEPLAGHLVAVVGVDELVVVDAIGGVALDTVDCDVAAVEGNYVVDEALAGGGEGEGLGGVWGIVIVRTGLTDFEILARGSAGVGEVCFAGVGGGHDGWTDGEQVMDRVYKGGDWFRIGWLRADVWSERGDEKFENVFAEGGEHEEICRYWK